MPTQRTPRPKGYKQPKQPKQPSSKGTRITDTHNLFLSGPLSNWCTDATPFCGTRALEILLPRLDEAGVNHPSPSALSTKLLARHSFNCGEQFMMACKGWLFERDREIERKVEALNYADQEELCGCVMAQQNSPIRQTRNTRRTQTQTPPSPSSYSNTSHSESARPQQSNAAYVVLLSKESNIELERLYQAHNTLVAVLSARAPGKQKALGRATRDYSEDIWTLASTHVVVAGCIARAEVDIELRKLYKFAGNTIPSPMNADTTNTPSTDDDTTTTITEHDSKLEKDRVEASAQRIRTFVEGSPFDCVWGVGMRWNDPRCDHEGFWRGENRLGKCHDEAARIVRETGIGQGW